MRVAHIFINYPNRYQPYNRVLLERLQAAGIVCFPFAFSGEGERVTYLRETRLRYLWYYLRALADIGNTVKFVKTYGYGLLEGALRWGRYSLIIQCKPHVIHVHQMQVLNPHFLNFLEYSKIPWLISLRGFETAIQPLLSNENHKFVKDALTRATGIHTVSEDLMRRAIAMGISGSKFQVIRRTVEVDKPIQNQASFAQGPFIIATIGRFNWKKGIVFLLQAIRLLLEDQVQVVLHVCGDGNEREQAEVKYWIWLLKLDAHVVLSGFLTSDQLDQRLKETHVYVQPSINEGIPNTLLRVLASRIPIVASAVDGIPEVIDHEVQGLLTLPGDPRSIAEAVKRLIYDSVLRTKINTSERKNIFIDPVQEVGKYSNFYETLKYNHYMNRPYGY